MISEKEIREILEECNLYSASPYLGSDGFHHKYGDDCISLEKLERILIKRLNLKE